MQTIKEILKDWNEGGLTVAQIKGRYNLNSAQAYAILYLGVTDTDLLSNLKEDMKSKEIKALCLLQH